MINPRNLFKANCKDLPKFKELVFSQDFQTALSYALSAVVTNNSLSDNELVGIKKFIDELMSLPEDELKHPQLPVKRLTHQLEPQRKKENAQRDSSNGNS